MAFAYVQSNSVTGTGSASLAFSSSVTTGNLLVALVGSNSHSTATITDSQSGVWVQIAKTGDFALWICFSAIGGSTTVLASGLNGSNDNLAIGEYVTESPLCYVFSPGITGPRAFGHIQQTVINTHVLILIGFYDFQSHPSWGTDNSTLRQTTSEADNASLALGDAIFSGGVISSQTCGLTGMPSNGSQCWGGFLMLYQGSSSGGGALLTSPGTQGGCNA